MKHALSLSILWMAIMLGFVGIGFFKVFFQVLSATDISLGNIVFPFLVGSFFLAAAFYMGFFAFKRIRSS